MEYVNDHPTVGQDAVVGYILKSAICGCVRAKHRLSPNPEVPLMLQRLQQPSCDEQDLRVIFWTLLQPQIFINNDENSQSIAFWATSGCTLGLSVARGGAILGVIAFPFRPLHPTAIFSHVDRLDQWVLVSDSTEKVPFRIKGAYRSTFLKIWDRVSKIHPASRASSPPTDLYCKSALRSPALSW